MGDWHFVSITGGERNVALPLFVRQTSGPALRGGGDCSGAPASLVGGSSPAAGTAAPAAVISPSASRRSTTGSMARPSDRRAAGSKRIRQGSLRRHKRLRVHIDLRGQRKGTFTVTVQGRTRRGRTVATDVRHYRTCRAAPKR